MQGTQTASLDTSKSPVYVSLIVVFVSTSIGQLHWHTYQGTQRSEFSIIVLLLCFGVSFRLFSVKRTVHEVLCCLNDCVPTPGAEPEYQPLQINTDHDLKTPDDSIFGLIKNQAPSDEQFEQALQTYQALTS